MLTIQGSSFIVTLFIYSDSFYLNSSAICIRVVHIVIDIVIVCLCKQVALYTAFQLSFSLRPSLILVSRTFTDTDYGRNIINRFNRCNCALTLSEISQHSQCSCISNLHANVIALYQSNLAKMPFCTLKLHMHSAS